MKKTLKQLGLVATLAAAGLGACKDKQQVSTAHTFEQVTKRGLARLGSYLFLEGSLFVQDGEFRLVEGNVQDLEGWVAGRHAEDKGEVSMELGWGMRFLHFAPSGALTLKDLWGHRLKYEAPANDPRFIFRLYSVGPNGADENGSGDDIDASRSYKAEIMWFEDPNFDGNTYRKYRGRLTLVEVNAHTSIRHP